MSASGGIPLDSKHKVQVHNEALEQAASFLIHTAEDFEQKANLERASMSRTGGRGALAAGAGPDHRARLHESVADLLRGQAAHIREMKLKEQ